MSATQAGLSLFVYGTLKRGERNHDRFCGGAVEVRAATTLGRLYELPFGFPGLRVPEENVYAVGTADYASDARRQHRHPADVADAPHGWEMVHGEIVVFDDPGRLPALDGLEGFTPGGSGLYERVLIPVEADEGRLLAWAYRLTREIGVRLPGGRWTAQTPHVS